MTANKPMTGEQLDELMTVAVNMQRDAETDCNRPSAMFAYAVQVAVLELRKARNDVAALAAENAGLKAAINEHSEGFTVCPCCGTEHDSCHDDVCRALNETPATDAFLAEVRAQAKADGVQEYADSFRHSASKIRECHGDTIRVRALLHEASNADEFAAQLRKGVQS
ncbi:hypothetical protein AYL25_11865 [Enterobacter roggenkampii]|uniref:hypothetical protein n=1 Tax=Enterobacter roggenkampii TaxID=1812935 RepID=UPI0007EED0AB|nr:hypothetical protein [Enterobacter roggenkampii]OBS89182.1 hypothetical protein AYL25_11865 [Enterobacter roggenkampii]